MERLGKGSGSLLPWDPFFWLGWHCQFGLISGPTGSKIPTELMSFCTGVSGLPCIAFLADMLAWSAVQWQGICPAWTGTWVLSLSTSKRGEERQERTKEKEGATEKNRKALGKKRTTGKTRNHLEFTK